MPELWTGSPNVGHTTLSNLHLVTPPSIILVSKNLIISRSKGGAEVECPETGYPNEILFLVAFLRLLMRNFAENTKPFTKDNSFSRISDLKSSKFWIWVNMPSLGARYIFRSGAPL